MIMLDLCSGFGGASAAMKERGWTVYRVDIEPRVKPDVVADIGALPFRPFPVDLLWVSPPCNAYARFAKKCWYPNEPEPDHTLYQITRQIISEWQPRWYVIENVQGAVRFWGQPEHRIGSRYLWTNIPLLPSVDLSREKSKRHKCWGSDPLRSAKRGYIPYPISLAVATTVEAMS